MTPLAILATSAPAAPDRAQLSAAARQFEAIFVRQMLTAARQTSFDDGMFSSEAMGTFRAMQDERFADIAAQRGSFGLARMIEAHLARFVSGGANGGADGGAGGRPSAAFGSTGSARAGVGSGSFPMPAQAEPVEARAPTPKQGAT